MYTAPFADVFCCGCFVPAAGNVTCPVELRNSGNMRLADVAVLGDDNDCNFALLEPNTTASCFMTRALTQDDFDTGLVELNGTAATATPRGPVTTLSSIPSDSAIVPLNQTAAMDLSANVNQSYVAAAGEGVIVTFTLGNTGSVTLRDLQLSVCPALANLACDNSSAVPDTSGDSVALALLSVDGAGSVVSCSGLLSFDQDALEAGPRNISVTGSGSAGNATAAAASQLVEVVPLNLPGLLVDVVGANCSLPGAAGGALACAVEVTNSGNVRLQSGNFTGTGTATVTACDFGVLQPGGKFSCQVEQALSQGDLDSADADSSYVVSVRVSATAAPMGSNSSAVNSADVQDVTLAPAVLHGIVINTTSASPTTVALAGELLPCLIMHIHREVVHAAA
jgi:hypothetical protein